MKSVIIALGGNALGTSSDEQELATRKTSQFIVDLIELDYSIVLTHGNGPQVGMINLALEGDNIPFPECIAMSQGYIGYHLEKALVEELDRRKLDKKVLTSLTQVIVDEDDPAFKNPTKPIGRYYSFEEAEVLKDRYTIKEDSNRGYRRFIASPKPVDIVEKDIIRENMEKGHLIIAGGGGGIPVIKTQSGYKGVDGVIDKDFTTCLMGQVLDIDSMIILTAVDKVYLNFGSEKQKAISKIYHKDLGKYIDNGEFGEGSMLPKIEASINFASSKNERQVIITSIEKMKDALNGESGTLIY